MFSDCRHLIPGGAIAQLGERLNGIQEVGGSTPPGSTKPHRLHTSRRKAAFVLFGEALVSRPEVRTVARQGLCEFQVRRDTQIVEFWCRLGRTFASGQAESPRELPNRDTRIAAAERGTRCKARSGWKSISPS